MSGKYRTIVADPAMTVSELKIITQVRREYMTARRPGSLPIEDKALLARERDDLAAALDNLTECATRLLDAMSTNHVEAARRALVKAIDHAEKECA